MAILQQANAVFYHPLDNLTESLQMQAWTGVGESFSAGKVSGALDAGSATGGTGITFGAESEFLSNPGVQIAAKTVAVALLAPGKFVVAYDNSSGGGVGGGTARVATVSGASVTYGLPAKFLSQGSAGTIWFISVAVLSATKFVVTYSDHSDTPPDPQPGVAKVGTVSGTDITFGAGTEFSSVGSVEHISATPLDVNRFVVAYSSGGTGQPGEARVGAVTGTSIAFAMVAEFDTGASKNTSVVALSATKIVIVWRDTTPTAVSASRAADVDGIGGITFGAANSIKPFRIGDVGEVSAAALDSTKFVVTYRTAVPAGGSARVGTVSGTDITYGAETQFSGEAIGGVAVAALSATVVAVTYEWSGGVGTTRLGTVDGTDIAFGQSAVHNAGTTFSQATVTLSATEFVVAYIDSSDADHGTVKIGTIAVYPTVIGGEHLVFASWTRSPNVEQFSGPPPQFFEETDRNMMIAMGMPASRLGGFT